MAAGSLVMRPEFLTPQERAFPFPDIVSAMLGMVGVNVTEEVIREAGWTKYELLIAYDWATREYLIASDNRVQSRDKPSFVTEAESRSYH